MLVKLKLLLKQRYFWIGLIGGLIFLLAVGYTYACQPKECYEDCGPEVTVVPSIEPSVEPTQPPCEGDCEMITPEPSVEPTGIPNVPAPSQPSDGKSDGRSSCPECTKTPEPVISLAPCEYPKMCGYK